MDAEIRLSSSEFKALASETRAGIIKLLKERNHTMTELSKKLGLSAPTIKQHLTVLGKAELIQELEEGRKWKYYKLTRKSKNIFLQESPVNVFIVLAVSVFSLAGMAYWFLLLAGGRSMAAVTAPSRRLFIEAADKAVPAAASGASQLASNQVPETIAIASQGFPPEAQLIALFFAGVAIAAIAGFFLAKARK